MSDIIMTVRARHIRHMREGRKKYELRKNRPSDFRAHNHYHTVWLCESGSGGRIVAAFRCSAYPEMTASADKLIAELCCITPEEVQGYRKGGKERIFGWLIEGFRYFKGTAKERHVTDFGVNRPPQSWCYAKQDDREDKEAEQ